MKNFFAVTWITILSALECNPYNPKMLQKKTNKKQDTKETDASKLNNGNRCENVISNFFDNSDFKTLAKEKKSILDVFDKFVEKVNEDNKNLDEEKGIANTLKNRIHSTEDNEIKKTINEIEQLIKNINSCKTCFENKKINTTDVDDKIINITKKLKLIDKNIESIRRKAKKDNKTIITNFFEKAIINLGYDRVYIVINFLNSINQRYTYLNNIYDNEVIVENNINSILAEIASIYKNVDDLGNDIIYSSRTAINKKLTDINNAKDTIKNYLNFIDVNIKETKKSISEVVSDIDRDTREHKYIDPHKFRDLETVTVNMNTFFNDIEKKHKILNFLADTIDTSKINNLVVKKVKQYEEDKKKREEEEKKKLEEEAEKKRKEEDKKILEETIENLKKLEKVDIETTKKDYDTQEEDIQKILNNIDTYVNEDISKLERTSKDDATQTFQNITIKNFLNPEFKEKSLINRIQKTKQIFQRLTFFETLKTMNYKAKGFDKIIANNSTNLMQKKIKEKKDALTKHISDIEYFLDLYPKLDNNLTTLEQSFSTTDKKFQDYLDILQGTLNDLEKYDNFTNENLLTEYNIYNSARIQNIRNTMTGMAPKYFLKFKTENGLSPKTQLTKEQKEKIKDKVLKSVEYNNLVQDLNYLQSEKQKMEKDIVSLAQFMSKKLNNEKIYKINKIQAKDIDDNEKISKKIEDLKKHVNDKDIQDIFKKFNTENFEKRLDTLYNKTPEYKKKMEQIESELKRAENLAKKTETGRGTLDNDIKKTITESTKKIGDGKNEIEKKHLKELEDNVQNRLDEITKYTDDFLKDTNKKEPENDKKSKEDKIKQLEEDVKTSKEKINTKTSDLEADYTSYYTEITGKIAKQHLNVNNIDLSYIVINKIKDIKKMENIKYDNKINFNDYKYDQTKDIKDLKTTINNKFNEIDEKIKKIKAIIGIKNMVVEKNYDENSEAKITQYFENFMDTKNHKEYDGTRKEIENAKKGIRNRRTILASLLFKLTEKWTSLNNNAREYIKIYRTIQKHYTSSDRFIEIRENGVHKSYARSSFIIHKLKELSKVKTKIYQDLCTFYLWVANNKYKNDSAYNKYDELQTILPLEEFYKEEKENEFKKADETTYNRINSLIYNVKKFIDKDDLNSEKIEYEKLGKHNSTSDHKSKEEAEIDKTIDSFKALYKNGNKFINDKLDQYLESYKITFDEITSEKSEYRKAMNKFYRGELEKLKKEIDSTDNSNFKNVIKKIVEYHKAVKTVTETLKNTKKKNTPDGKLNYTYVTLLENPKQYECTTRVDYYQVLYKHALDEINETCTQEIVTNAEDRTKLAKMAIESSNIISRFEDDINVFNAFLRSTADMKKFKKLNEYTFNALISNLCEKISDIYRVKLESKYNEEISNITKAITEINKQYEALVDDNRCLNEQTDNEVVEYLNKDIKNDNAFAEKEYKQLFDEYKADIKTVTNNNSKIQENVLDGSRIATSKIIKDLKYGDIEEKEGKKYKYFEEEEKKDENKKEEKKEEEKRNKRNNGVYENNAKKYIESLDNIKKQLKLDMANIDNQKILKTEYICENHAVHVIQQAIEKVDPFGSDNNTKYKAHISNIIMGAMKELVEKIQGNNLFNDCLNFKREINGEDKYINFHMREKYINNIAKILKYLYKWFYDDQENNFIVIGRIKNDNFIVKDKELVRDDIDELESYKRLLNDYIGQILNKSREYLEKIKYKIPKKQKKPEENLPKEEKEQKEKEIKEQEEQEEKEFKEMEKQVKKSESEKAYATCNALADQYKKIDEAIKENIIEVTKKKQKDYFYNNIKHELTADDSKIIKDAIEYAIQNYNLIERKEKHGNKDIIIREQNFDKNLFKKIKEEIKFNPTDDERAKLQKIADIGFFKDQEEIKVDNDYVEKMIKNAILDYENNTKEIKEQLDIARILGNYEVNVDATKQYLRNYDQDNHDETLKKLIELQKKHSAMITLKNIIVDDKGNVNTNYIDAIHAHHTANDLEKADNASHFVLIKNNLIRGMDIRNKEERNARIQEQQQLAEKIEKYALDQYENRIKTCFKDNPQAGLELLEAITGTKDHSKGLRIGLDLFKTGNDIFNELPEESNIFSLALPNDYNDTGLEYYDNKQLDKIKKTNT